MDKLQRAQQSWTEHKNNIKETEKQIDKIEQKIQTNKQTMERINHIIRKLTSTNN